MCALWAAPTAGAAEVSKRDRAGDVIGGAAFTKPQRAALDIERVSARANAAGLAVDVRLRGDFERLAGNGALKGAVAELLIRRKGGRSGKLVTSGSDRRSPVALRARRAEPGRRARRAPGPFPGRGRRLHGDLRPRAGCGRAPGRAREDGLGPRGGVVRPARADRRPALPGLRRAAIRPRTTPRPGRAHAPRQARVGPPDAPAAGARPPRGLPVRPRQADPLRLPDAARALQPQRHRVADEPDADLALHRQPARPGLRGGPDADLRRRRLQRPRRRGRRLRVVRRRPAAPDRLRGEAEPLVRRPGHVPDHAQHQRPARRHGLLQQDAVRRRVGRQGAAQPRQLAGRGSAARGRARSPAAAPSR